MARHKHIHNIRIIGLRNDRTRNGPIEPIQITLSVILDESRINHLMSQAYRSSLTPTKLARLLTQGRYTK
jgi:hypothetical protein